MLNHEKHTMVRRKLAFGKQLRNAQNLENLSVLSYVMVKLPMQENFDFGKEKLGLDVYPKWGSCQ